MNEGGQQSHIPARLWWSVVGLLVLILIVGLGDGRVGIVGARRRRAAPRLDPVRLTCEVR
jgi:hypothetical protein